MISKILSATILFFEYSIIPHPKPTAMLVPINDSNTASKINGSLIYVEDAPTSLIIFISFFLEYAANRSVLIIRMNAAKPISNAKVDADSTSVLVKLKSLSIASPLVLISFTAGLPSILSIISS